MVKISQKIKNKEKEINLYKNEIKNPFNVSNEVFKLQIFKKQIEIKILNQKKVLFLYMIFLILSIISLLIVVTLIIILLISITPEWIESTFIFKIIYALSTFAILTIIFVLIYSSKKEKKNLENLEIKKDQISKKIFQLYCEIK